MTENPTLFVCHGDEGGPRIHPCRRVQEALRAAGIEYDKVIAAHGNPIPFLRKGSSEELREATGATKLPALKLADGDGHHPIPRHPRVDRPAGMMVLASVLNRNARQRWVCPMLVLKSVINLSSKPATAPRRSRRSCR